MNPTTPTLPGRTRLAAAAVLGALALATAACGEDSTVVGTSPTTLVPGGGNGDDPVIQVVIAGGFVPVEVAVTTVPTVTVLADGTVLTLAPVLAIFPGPAITPVQSTSVSTDQVDELVELAESLGLDDDDLNFGQPPVADAPDTTVTIAFASGTVTHSANALGLGDLAGPEGNPGSATAGVSAQEQENRRNLQAFLDALHALPPGEEIHRPSVVAVYDLGPYRADAELTQNPVDWPLDQVPPASDGVPGECLAVNGNDVEVLLAALETANSLTPWVVDADQRSLAFRPVLPGQPAC